MEEALTLCAQSMMVKSQMSLMQDAEDATQAGMLKAFSKRVGEMAERIAPDDWAPNRDASFGGAGGTAIQINIQGVSVDGKALIPGTEVLAGARVVEHVVEHAPEYKENKDEEIINDPRGGSLGFFGHGM